MGFAAEVKAFWSEVQLFCAVSLKCVCVPRQWGVSVHSHQCVNIVLYTFVPYIAAAAAE